MKSVEELILGEPLECLSDVSKRTWVLAGVGQLAKGSCYIADATDDNNVKIVGFIDGETGDAFTCSGEGGAPDYESGPAVRIIAERDKASGQVTVRQEKGNYLRICRWDSIDSNLALLQGATLRTLPQCGCGGSLGTPKLFSSLNEMAAYHFCAFYL